MRQLLQRKDGTARAVRRLGALVVPLVLVVAALAAPAGAKTSPGGGGGTGTDGSTFTSISAPPSGCGRTASARAVFHNSGSTVWSAGTYRIVAVGAAGWTPGAVVLGGHNTAPGADATFIWNATAPSMSGTFTWTWQMSNGAKTFGPTSPASTITQTCSIGDLFAGASQLVDDPSFGMPASAFQNHGSPGHSDTATVDSGINNAPDRYRLYYRSFNNPNWGANGNGIPAGIAMATSRDGIQWTQANSAIPVVPARPAAGTTGCASDPNQCITPYAPSVIKTASGYTMAYEVMDNTVPGGSTSPRNWIEASTSTDGLTWAPVTLAGSPTPAKVLVAATAWEGLNANVHVGNVGTPDLHLDNGVYTLGYHGFDGRHFARGVATGTDLTALTRDPSNPKFVGASGWTATGPGKAGDTTEGAYTYRVFEAFNGPVGCVRNDTEVGWGLARSSDGGNTWQYSSVNPIRTDRVGFSCGEDMPSWQIIGANPMVLTTRINAVPSGAPNVRRYKISPAAPGLTTGSPIVALAMADNTNGYWEVDSAGGIAAFGGARSLTGPSTGGALVKGAAAKPDGTGLWLVTGNGQVLGAGSATALGNAQGTVTAVAIESDAAGDGYWIVLSDGSVQRVGNAPAPALTAGALVAAPAAIVRVPAAAGIPGGFWVMDRSGAFASYNGAPSLPAAVGMTASAVGFAAGPDGKGALVVDANGRVYAVGTGTASIGDTSSTQVPNGYQPFAHFGIVGMSSRLVGSDGYYLVASDGGVLDFGSAPYVGHVRGSGFNN